MTDALLELNDNVGRRVRAGFDTFEEIVEDVTDLMGDEHPETEWRPAVERATLEAFNALRIEQASWPSVTDCDRIDSAFASLENAGIVARQNFACCQNCGHDEIMDEVREAAATREVRGYVFFHMQDTDGVLEDGELFLAYNGRDDQQAVGWEIVEALKKQGLAVTWDGDVKKRIAVKSIRWLRRRDFSTWGRA